MPFTVGPKMQAGRVLTGTDGTATVTFPEPFSRVPKVFLQGVDQYGRGIVVDLVSVSETGFTLKARQTAAPPTGSFLTGLSYSTGSFVTGGSDPGHSHSNPSTDSAGDHKHIAVKAGSGSTTAATAYERALWGGDGVNAAAFATTLSGASAVDLYTSSAGAHTHTQGNTGSSYTGITLYTSPAVTGVSASSGTAVTGGSQAISIYVDWLAVEI